jgi:hypothetical protein
MNLSRTYFFKSGRSIATTSLSRAWISTEQVPQRFVARAAIGPLTGSLTERLGIGRGL